MKKNIMIVTLVAIAMLLLIFGLYQKARADKLEKINSECNEITNRLKAEVELFTAIACFEKTKSLEDQLKSGANAHSADQGKRTLTED